MSNGIATLTATILTEKLHLPVEKMLGERIQKKPMLNQLCCQAHRHHAKF